MTTVFWFQYAELNCELKTALLPLTFNLNGLTVYKSHSVSGTMISSSCQLFTFTHTVNETKQVDSFTEVFSVLYLIQLPPSWEISNLFRRTFIPCTTILNSPVHFFPALSTPLFTFLSAGLVPHGMRAQLKPLTDSNIYVMVCTCMRVFMWCMM